MIGVLGKTSAKVTNNTSFQVSIGTKAFQKNLLYLKRFLMLWSYLEDITYRFGYGETDIPRDKIMTRALPCGDLLSSYLFLIEGRKQSVTIEEHFGALHTFLYGKHYGIYIDIDGYAKNRMELRNANSSLDKGILQNIIFYFLRMMDVSQKEDFPWDKIENKWSKTFERYLPFPTKYSFPYGPYQKNIINAEEDFSKACEAADLLFETDDDRELFWKQYTKKF